MEFKIPHFPVEEGTRVSDWIKGIPPRAEYRRFLQNCRNCGASEIKNGNCVYCSTQY